MEKQTWLHQVCSMARYWGLSHGNDTGVQRGRKETHKSGFQTPLCAFLSLNLRIVLSTTAFKVTHSSLKNSSPFPTPTELQQVHIAGAVESCHSTADKIISSSHECSWMPSKQGVTIKTAHTVVLPTAHPSLVSSDCLLSCRQFLYVCGKEKRSDSWSEHHTI